MDATDWTEVQLYALLYECVYVFTGHFQETTLFSSTEFLLHDCLDQNLSNSWFKKKIFI